MAEPIDAAIEKALLDKAIAFAAAQSPVLTISVENGLGVNGRHFTKPKIETKTEQYLKAWILPIPSVTTAISFTAHAQHWGYLQIDVIRALGGGTMPIKRTISAIREYFPMGLTLTLDGFEIQISPFVMKRVVSQGPLMEDGPGWMKIPVSIPWVCFEKPA